MPGDDRPRGRRGAGDGARRESARPAGQRRNANDRDGPRGATGAQGRGGSAPGGGGGERSGRPDRSESQRDRDRAGDKGREAPKSTEQPATVPREPDPAIDDDVTGDELADDVVADLSTLSGVVAAQVARHLVMAARLLDDDPEQAYQHAAAARRRSGRLAVIREAAGVAAYRAERYAEALGELRAVRRMTGSPDYLPMMADCERGLGRPRRALDLASDPATSGLDTAGKVEMAIVASGARRDVGDPDTAVATLALPELRSRSSEPWVVRLRYAYADALVDAGRNDEAREWFLRTATVDPEDATDAASRAIELSADNTAARDT